MEVAVQAKKVRQPITAVPAFDIALVCKKSTLNPQKFLKVKGCCDPPLHQMVITRLASAQEQFGNRDDASCNSLQHKLASCSSVCIGALLTVLALQAIHGDPRHVMKQVPMCL